VCTNRSENEIDQTNEPVEVEWQDGLVNIQTVRVDPYTGKITVNGREFAIGSLCSDDVPDWMHRSHPSGADRDV